MMQRTDKIVCHVNVRHDFYFDYLILSIVVQIFQRLNSMKTKKILFGAGITLTVLLLIQIIKRKKAGKKLEKRLYVVAEEGYETAEDILFPRKKSL
jgi:hypothetical protein